MARCQRAKVCPKGLSVKTLLWDAANRRYALPIRETLTDCVLNTRKFSVGVWVWRLEFVDRNPLVDLGIDYIVAIVVQEETFAMIAVGDIGQIFDATIPLHERYIGKPSWSEIIVDERFNDRNAHGITNSRVDVDVSEVVTAELQKRLQAGPRKLAHSI